MLGVDDRYGTSAENYEILLRHYGLEAEDVAKKARSVLADK
jgi:transketolase